MATGPTPTGPFTDLGYPLIATDPYITDIIDPAVFIDSDGQAYIYYGGSAQSKLVIRKLASNMTSFTSGAILATPSFYTEAPHMLKRGNTYYLTYSNGSWTNSTYNIRYATSTSPTGPWTYRGQILGNWDAFTGNGHASIIFRPGCDGDYQDEYFIAYHRYQNGDYTTRRVCIDRLYFSQGLILPVYPTWAGVVARPPDPAGGGCIVPNTIANGTYRIVSKMTTSTAQPLVLDIFGCSASREADLGTWTPTPCLGQRWLLTYLDGFYRITSQQPPGHYALDMTGCNISMGANLGLWDNTGHPCQQYRIEPVPGSGGYYRIMNRVSGYVLDVSECSNVPGANITHWVWKNLDCQLWKFEPIDPNAPNQVRSAADSLKIAETKNADEESVSVFPNPANNELNIVNNILPGNEQQHDFRFTLVSGDGRIVRSGSNKQQTTVVKLDVKNLPNGIYLVQIEKRGKRITKKVLINHSR